jgi:nucleoid-associated protein YgaU
MPTILRSTVRLTAWTAGLLIAGRLLYSAGSGTAGLRIPLTSLADARTWLADTPPPTMAMAVVRVVALAAVAYLLAATALAVAANLVGARPLQTAAQRLTPAVVRRLATGGGGVGLALGVGLGALPVPDLAPHPIVAAAAAGAAEAAPAPAAPDVATMIRNDPHLATMTRLSDPPDPGTSAAPTAAPSAAEPGSGPGPEETGATPGPGTSSSGPTGSRGGGAQPRDGGDGGGSGSGDATGTPLLPPLTATMIRTDGASVPATGSLPSSLPQSDETWVVQPGDSFWSIAEDVLGSPGDVPPGERDVGRYWCRLIDANRAGLVDPGNPDLLVPGQELVVPPP